jgi:hypothetical protein
MVMRERVGGMLAHDFRVKTNRGRVVFDAEGIVCVSVADLLLAAARAGGTPDTW